MHMNGNLQIQLRLSQNLFAHGNRNKRLAARILQLRRPSGFIINSDQEMAELLKMTFLAFFCEVRGQSLYSNNAHKPAWLTRSLLNWKSGVRWTALTLIECSLVLMGFSLTSSKPLAPTLPLCFPGCLNLHFQGPRSPKMGPAP